MFLIDTSVFVHMLRDSSGANLDRVLAEVGDDEIAIARPVEMELLAGTKSEKEWAALTVYLSAKPKVSGSDESWASAARIFFDLQRRGLSCRKVIDCYIAQLAIENDLVLVHDDRDFAAIAGVRTLKHLQIALAVSRP